MPRKNTKTAAAEPAKQTILVAVGELRGGGEVLDSGAELTPEMQKAMGLSAEEVTDLVARGHLNQTKARVAAHGGEAELAAALARAEAAEAKVIELEARARELEAELAEATKPKA
jgi:hypothetical protein